MRAATDHGGGRSEPTRRAVPTVEAMQRAPTVQPCTELIIDWLALAATVLAVHSATAKLISECARPKRAAHAVATHASTRPLPHQPPATAPCVPFGACDGSRYETARNRAAATTLASRGRGYEGSLAPWAGRLRRRTGSCRPVPTQRGQELVRVLPHVLPVAETVVLHRAASCGAPPNTKRRLRSLLSSASLCRLRPGCTASALSAAQRACTTPRPSTGGCGAGSQHMLSGNGHPRFTFSLTRTDAQTEASPQTAPTRVDYAAVTTKRLA